MWTRIPYSARIGLPVHQYVGKLLGNRFCHHGKTRTEKNGKKHMERYGIPNFHRYRKSLATSSRGGRQVNPNPSESPVQQIVNVEQLPQNPRLLNVGPKAAKWAGNTPLSAFKIDLILHFRATELPKQKWGIASLAFLSGACRTTFLSRLAAERGLQTDPKLVAQEEITRSDFSRIMTEVFGQ